MHKIKDVLLENDRRTQLIDAPFNPMTGEGSFIERRLVSYMDSGNRISYMAPASMAELPVIKDLIEFGSVENFINKRLDGYSDDKHKKFAEGLFDLRLTHDFEFYTYSCVKIPDKESEDLIPFKLNRCQRKLIAKYEKMRLAKKPIRLILAKARQWGGSTATQIYMNWIQLRHKKRWNMAICTLVNAQASHIRYMFERTIENFPQSIGRYTLSNYGTTNTVKMVNERDCIIGVGSTQSPENLRTYNIHMCHLSEVGSWEDTPKRSGKSLAQSLRGSVKNLPYTMIVMESTAKGVGNFFHHEWVASTTGKSGYENLFIPWYEIEMYREPIDNYEEFVKVLDEQYSSDGTKYWYLWELGATLEGINWYRNHKTRENMDDISMWQEFPSTSSEAFSSTGRPAFSPMYIKKAEVNCEPPLYKGELSASGSKGKPAFDKIKFDANINGGLWIWSMPDTTIKIANRYAGFADIGGRHRLSDFSCLKVLDRYWMIEGGVPEVCAVWHGHIDQDLFSWKAAQIMWWYNKGMFAIESNSLEKGDDSEGDHFLTVLDEIAEFYPNLYTRTNPEQIREGVPNLWGFHTNRKTKPMLIDGLNAALRDDSYIEKDIRATNEMYTYEIKENGTYGAKEGLKDDHVIITAGGVWLSTKYMPLPVEIKEERRQKERRPVSQATF
jgi:hypothetical protein